MSSALARIFNAAACVAPPVITEAREACAPMPRVGTVLNPDPIKSFR